MDNEPAFPRRSWQVLLIGGASGVGKTSVSRPLARHYDVGITQVDDFQVVLERMTTPAQYPDVHLFRRTPELWFRMDDDDKLVHAIAYATTMAEALEPVIANHLTDEPPIVMEGDFILPALAARERFDGAPAAGRVRAVFILEEDAEQIARNYALREGGEPGVHRERARSSARYGAWLGQEATRLGLPTVAARPWETALARVLARIDGAEPGN